MDECFLDGLRWIFCKPGRTWGHEVSPFHRQPLRPFCRCDTHQWRFRSIRVGRPHQPLPEHAVHEGLTDWRAWPGRPEPWARNFVQPRTLVGFLCLSIGLWPGRCVCESSDSSFSHMSYTMSYHGMYLVAYAFLCFPKKSRVARWGEAFSLLAKWRFHHFWRFLSE